MKKVLLSFLVILIFSVSTVFASNGLTFQKSQSYELVDLVDFFAVSSPYVTSVRSSRIDELDYFWWDRNPQEVITSGHTFILTGKVGLLLNNNGNKEKRKIWKDGLIVANTIETGDTAGLYFVSPTSGFYTAMVIRLGITASSVEKRMFGEYSPKLDWAKYFNDHNFPTEQLWENGYLGNGETGWKINVPNKAPVYMICRTDCGANGILGTTVLLFYFNEEEMLKEKSAKHHYYSPY